MSEQFLSSFTSRGLQTLFDVKPFKLAHILKADNIFVHITCCTFVQNLYRISISMKTKCMDLRTTPAVDQFYSIQQLSHEDFLQCISFIEPPPTFIWTHPHLGELQTNEEFTILHEEYQGGSTTTLVIHHAKNSDAGTYSLQADNRNGTEKVDLDLIVLDALPDCECLMYKTADKMCTCSHSYTG